MEIKEIKDRIVYSSHLMRLAHFDSIGRIISQLSHNLYSDVVKKAGSSSKGMLIFPLEYSVTDKNYEEMGVAEGCIKYAELDFPVRSSSPLMGLILEEAIDNLKVVKIENSPYASCPHRVGSGLSTIYYREGAEPIPTTYSVTQVPLRPVCQGKEYVGAIGRCPVCGTVYVSEGGKFW